VFKSIQYQLYIFTLLLVASVAGFTVLLIIKQFVLAILAFLLIIYCLVRLKTCYDKYNKNIIFLLNALENGDYTYRFSERKISVREREMNMTFNRIKEILEKARTQVIENEEFLSIILESVSTGIIILDDAGIVHKINRTALEMLGLPVFTHVAQLQAIDESYPELFKNLGAGDSRQLTLSSEKEEIQVSLRVSQIWLKRGLMRVITLNNIGNELEMKEMESWTRLIRVMTHEIMNSIAPITSISETMTDVCKSAAHISRQETAEAFETINSTAKGLLSFVDSYRKFTSIPTPRKEPFDLTALAEKVAKLHSQQASESGAEIAIISPQSPVVAFADVNLIQQVLINLVKNALEAPESKRITISIHPTERGAVSLEVANDGQPIPPETLPHIFIPFFTTKTDGSGVGLSVSRYIMRLHGGKLLHRISEAGETVFEVVV
jgi:nitrogen fixation/metabolism regulation signal transduction histidine kinase